MNLHKSSPVLTLMLMTLAATLGGLKAYIDYRLHQELDSFKKVLASHFTLDYHEVKLSLTGALVIDNLQVTLPEFSPLPVDKVTLYRAYQFYNPQQFPATISLAVTGIHLPLSDTSTPPPLLIKALGYATYYLTPKELRALGYSEVNADLFLETHLIDKNKLQMLVTLKANYWGDLSLALDLNNVPPFPQWATLAPQIQVAKLALSYTDHGFFNRVFTWLAQRNTMTLDHFKQALSQQLQNDFNSLAVNSQASLRQFIELPQILTIYWQPDLPLFISKLLNNTLMDVRIADVRINNKYIIK